MFEISVWLEGTMPLLQNKMVDGVLEGGGTRKNTAGEKEDPRTIAGRLVYRLSDGQIGLAGAAVSRMLREAGGMHKMKGSRKSVKYVLPAAVLVLDEVCGLYLHDRATPIVDFEVDARPVVIPSTKGRVIRYRPRFNEWSVHVNLRINEDILDAGTVRQIMIEGASQVGLGDFRPEKGGPFGVSSLVSWDVMTDRKKTDAQLRNGNGAAAH